MCKVTKHPLRSLGLIHMDAELVVIYASEAAMCRMQAAYASLSVHSISTDTAGYPNVTGVWEQINSLNLDSMHSELHTHTPTT